jgi:hypothetical protein
MNPNEINKAIAEYCGWTHGNLNDHEIMFKDRQSACVAQGRIHKQRIEMGIDPTRGTTPDYYNDLNAIHEAEKVLSDASFVYDRHLAETPGSGFTWGSTAAQRAEAFLRTIGKWKE